MVLHRGFHSMVYTKDSILWSYMRDSILWTFTRGSILRFTQGVPFCGLTWGVPFCGLTRGVPLNWPLGSLTVRLPTSLGTATWQAWYLRMQLTPCIVNTMVNEFLSHSTSIANVIIIIIDRFYIALFSALEQTHCARMFNYHSTTTSITIAVQPLHYDYYQRCSTTIFTSMIPVVQLLQ